MGKLVALVGPSGVGKTTIISNLVGPGQEYCRVLHYTTRPPRWYEKHGHDYRFVTDQRLNELLETDPSLSTSVVSVNGHRFALSYREIEDAIQANRICLIELFIERIPTIAQKFGPNYTGLFLMPTTLDVLAQRLKEYRGHDKQFIVRRMTQARRELDLGQGAMRPYFDRMLLLPDGLPESIDLVRSTISGSSIELRNTTS